MSFESILRTDILPSSYFERPETLEVEYIGQGVYQSLVSEAQRFPSGKTNSPLPAKNIIEVMEVIKQAIEDYEKRQHAIEQGKVLITYEDADVDAEFESISFDLTRREPGMFGQGRPFENASKQLRPILREETEDPDNPGYRRAVLGYCYDNILTLTAWARTNKQANARALWLENVMEEYTWFFVYSGINRMLYQGRKTAKTREVNGQKIYGRPVDYYVRTEKLRSVSQKELEQIVLRLRTASQ